MTNPATGDTLDYMVLGDAARGSDVLVYFNGTGQILPGWPVQLITNSTYSPKIASTAGYRRDEDGSVSLCHDYRLVLFDYPGVGRTPYKAINRDAVASDVDSMLNDVTAKFGISTSVVDPIGWSLGTTMALKYAFLSPVSRPKRKIHNIILYAAHGGGSEQGLGSGQGACVATLFDASLSATGTVGDQIKGDLTKLIYPYRGQDADDNGTHSGCTASVSSTAVKLSVTPHCTIANSCKGFLASSLADIETDPWRRTKGIGKVYGLEREWSGDYNVAYCAKAAAHFTSASCTAYGSIQQSVTNGGICKTDTSNQNKPVAAVCDALDMTGKVTLMAGYEDLFVQWTYDKALVQGLNAARAGSASLHLYPGFAGHGLLVQHPMWAQAQTFDAMQRS